ncbi:MAG TPA: choice-of-anchor Q domain-containing protein [Rhodanobacteraceae bacterium]|nr:choice-of-anchor Q domain-containing protein [Rhodanobacteraceae bacterium]
MSTHELPAVPLTSIPVTNCDDSGAGSLRDAVNNAVDGDTVDMTGLTCSAITLTSGAISTGVANLTIQGPGVLALAIYGNDTDRVFWHIGSGTLTINDVTVEHGKKYLNNGDLGNPGGGCVLTAGTLAFNHSWAKYCETGSNDTSVAVHGGAIYAASGIAMTYSFVTSNSANSAAYFARGGGIYTPGAAIIDHSIISGNTVTGVSGGGGGGMQIGSVRGTSGETGSIKYSTISSNMSSTWGGGVYLTGDVYIGNSTISGNQALAAGGVYAVHGSNVTGPAAIENSTISGNSATANQRAGGLQSFGDDLQIRDSTIAFNTAISGTTTKYGAGVRTYSANNIELENTIIASNKTSLQGTDPEADDLGGASGTTTSGAQNLIFFTDVLAPGGTILLTDPVLRALAANGGVTNTHMPNFGSPVIDVGNNESGVTVDQRGSGFPRILGPQADIGAVEFDLSDEIFANGFD